MTHIVVDIPKITLSCNILAGLPRWTGEISLSAQRKDEGLQTLERKLWHFKNGKWFIEIRGKFFTEDAYQL